MAELKDAIYLLDESSKKKIRVASSYGLLVTGCGFSSFEFQISSFYKPRRRFFFLLTEGSLPFNSLRILSL
jgi:hypothetical protein